MCLPHSGSSRGGSHVPLLPAKGCQGEKSLIGCQASAPNGGLDDAGNLLGVLDIYWHYQTAKANGAAAHIQRKPSASAPAH